MSSSPLLSSTVVSSPFVSPAKLIGALATGWICGSIFIPMIPSLLIHPTWTLELLTSMFAYGFLFAACTFLK